MLIYVVFLLIKNTIRLLFPSNRQPGTTVQRPSMLVQLPMENTCLLLNAFLLLLYFYEKNMKY